MICEKCKGKMNWSIEGATQGWRCPMCGWNIKFVAKTANVNFVIAKQMLEKREACILKAKAPKIKLVITKLQELGIDFNVNPSFNY